MKLKNEQTEVLTLYINDGNVHYSWTNSLESKIILEHVLHSSYCGQEVEVANLTFLRRCDWNHDALRGKTDELYERQAPQRTWASCVRETIQVPLTQGKLVAN